jgi:hypothetical protein
MYYEEQIINGILCYRNSPTSDWIEMTPKQLTSRIKKLKKEIKKFPTSFIAGSFSDDLMDIALAENENRVIKTETFIPAFEEDNVVCHFFWIKDSKFPIPK